MIGKKEKLKECIENMDNEDMIEKLYFFIMGMRAQQGINENGSDGKGILKNSTEGGKANEEGKNTVGGASFTDIERMFIE